MTPNFALNLSEDGIDLLHRDPAGSGWVKVGSVSLNSDKLPDDMHALRDIAVELEGEKFCTKLILPPSQLLYLTVDADGDTDIANALEDRTPYKIDDLTYDSCSVGPQTTVVAVARETLSEARSFLAPYDLNPIGFTAKPKPDQFAKEPNLGPIGSGRGFIADLEIIQLVEDYAKPLTKKKEDTKEDIAADAKNSDGVEKPIDEDDSEKPAVVKDSAAASPVEPSKKTKQEAQPKQATTETAPPPPRKPSASNPSAFASRRKPTAGATIPSGDRIAKQEPRIAVPNPHAPRTPSGLAKAKLSSSTHKAEIAKAKTAITAQSAPSAKKPNTKPATKSVEGTRKTAAPTGTKSKQSAAKPATKSPSASTRNARASHLIGGKKAPLPLKSGKELPAARASSLRAPAGKMPDPIAELAARQAAAAPQRSGILVTFMALVAFGVLALGSVMLLRSEPFGGPSNTEPLELAVTNPTLTATVDEAISEPDAIALPEIADDLSNVPLDTTLPSEEFDTAAKADIAPASEQPIQTDAGFETTEPLVPLKIPQMNEQTAARAYASSGAWQFVPDLDARSTPPPPAELFVQSLDQSLAFEDPPALPRTAAIAPASFSSVEPLPLAPGLRFALDEQGFVIPTPEGALSPDGVLVFAGLPPVTPNPRPRSETSTAEPAVETEPSTEPSVVLTTVPDDVPARAETSGPVGGISSAALAGADSLAPGFTRPETPAVAELVEDSNLPLPPPDPALAQFRPDPRPADLQERVERATLGGLSRIELAAFRPDPRPLAAQERAEQLRSASLASIDAINNAVEEAQSVPLAAPPPLDAESLALKAIRPEARPIDLARLAARNRANTTPAAPEQASTASVRATGPAVRRSSRAEPTAPTAPTVARAATDNNAISLGRVALIGVFGTSSDRRALVRLPNGRFKKVTVGDNVDGGRVAAIGETQLKYVKGGRTLTLAMPQG